jgi:hypothetical protein
MSYLYGFDTVKIKIKIKLLKKKKKKTQAPLPSQSNLHPLGQGMMLNER